MLQRDVYQFLTQALPNYDIGVIEDNNGYLILRVSWLEESTCYSLQYCFHIHSVLALQDRFVEQRIGGRSMLLNSLDRSPVLEEEYQRINRECLNQALCVALSRYIERINSIRRSRSSVDLNLMSENSRARTVLSSEPATNRYPGSNSQQWNRTSSRNIVDDLLDTIGYVRQATGLHQQANPKPSQCVGCINYYGKTHGGNWLCCGIHPHGPQEECADYESKE